MDRRRAGRQRGEEHPEQEHGEPAPLRAASRHAEQFGERGAGSVVASPLGRGPEMYQKFRDKEDGCIKIVLKP